MTLLLYFMHIHVNNRVIKSSSRQCEEQIDHKSTRKD